MAQQNPNEIGAMMAAQNELSGLNAGRAQNSQAEQAFLQQQQAANAVMMQAAQIGTSGGLGQQVGAMNPQTQALLAQYGVTGAPSPGKTTSNSKTTQSGGNVKIENHTTTNNDIKIVNPPSQGGGDGGNQAKFQAWLSNAFAKQNQDYEVQKRTFARRDRDLEKQSNKMMRELQKSTSTLGEKLNPKTWAAANGDQTKKVLGMILLAVAPTLVKPIAEKLQNLRDFFSGDGGGKGFFGRLKSAIGLGEKETSLPEAIGKVISDGIKGIKTWFGSIFEERKRAIESIEKPKKHMNGDKDASILWRMGDWLQYVSNVISAGLGGFSSLADNQASDMRTEAQNEFTNTREEAATMQQGVLRLTHEDTHMQRHISKDYYDLGGRLKGGNSLGSMAVTRAISAEININGLGIDKDASIIGKRMSDLESLLEREGSYIMGEEIDALNFLDVWGFDKNYLELLLKEGLIYTKELLEITYKTGRHTIDSGYFEKDKPRPDNFDSKNIISERDITLYIMTKDGFDRIKKDTFGDEKFKFRDASNDAAVFNKLSNIHSDQTFKNGDKFQQVQTAVEMSATFETERKNIDYGAAGELVQEFSDSAGKTAGKVRGFVSSAWKSLTGRGAKGEYDNTEEGKQNFVEDLYSIFSRELFSYYKGKGLSDEEATNRASSMASILTAQCALESGYGTNSNSKHFNYANLTGGTRTGEDKDKNGKKIEQKFRDFNSGEEFAQALINLLDKGKQYEGALFAETAEDYFKMIQRGYDGVYNPNKIGPDNGKFAEDKKYVEKGIAAAEGVIPTIENLVKTIETQEVDAGAGEASIKYDGSTPHYITPDKQYKATFDRLRIGNLEEGETPWDAMTGLYQYNHKTGKYDIPVDKNIFSLGDPNGLRDTINRGVSSNQYPEIHSLMFDKIGPKDGILFYRQPRKNFSKYAQQKIIETKELLEGNEKNKEDYDKIPFYLIPTKDGKQFQINTISVRTGHYSETAGPMYTGFVFEQPNDKFPDEYYTTNTQKTLEGLPTGRNPLFYSIQFDLDEEGREALWHWEHLLKTDFYIDAHGIVRYSDDNEYVRKNIIEKLEKLGLITNTKRVNMGIGNNAYSAEMTEAGRELKDHRANDEAYGWSDQRYNYLSAADWNNMSDEEKSKYIDYLSTLTSDPQKKVQLELLKGTANLAVEEAQRIVGVLTPNSIKPPTAVKVSDTTTSALANGSSPASSPITSNVGNDYSSHDQRVYNIYGTWSNGADNPVNQ